MALSITSITEEGKLCFSLKCREADDGYTKLDMMVPSLILAEHLGDKGERITSSRTAWVTKLYFKKE